jgi:uncharacterized protein (DUF169 family)
MKIRESRKQLIEEVMREFLNLEGSPVGVKVLRTLDDLPSGVEEIDAPRRHCEMIQKARLERSVFYAPLSKQQCKVGATALGLMEPNAELRKHQLEEQFRTKRRFRTEDALWTYVENTPTLPHQGVAVMYGPLGSIPVEPDSVVIVCNPVQAMRLVQAYQHTTGERAGASLGALFSLCADAVASPILTGDLSIALGCGGSRKHAAMKESELALGFPYSIANELADASLTLARYEKQEEHSAGG